MKILKVSVVVFLLFLLGCASGHCLRNQHQLSSHLSSTKKELTAKKKEEKPHAEHVLVYKYDGSKQCGDDAGISLVDMQKEFKNIVVYSAVKKNDNLMHITVCGGVTGQANVYEIDKVNLDKAEKRGFKVWRFK